MAQPRAKHSQAIPPALKTERFTVRAWPFALFFLLPIIFHAKILFSASDMMIGTIDIVFYFRWLHTYTFEEFMTGRIPLWNPYTYCGTPFAANPQATVFYPLSWLFLLMPVIHAHKFMIALHSVLAGSFMYLFLREAGRTEPPRHGGTEERLLGDGESLTQRNEGVHAQARTAQPVASPCLGVSVVQIGRPAAAIGAIAFMFGNHFMTNAAVGHLTMIFTSTWLPLALYFYERALSCGRWLWLMWAGMVLGVQLLAGEPQNSYYSVVLLSVYGLVRTMMTPTGGHWLKVAPRRLLIWAAGLSVVGVVSAAASAIQLIPTAEFAVHSDRSANNFTFSSFASLPPMSLLEFLVPWSNEPGEPWGIGVESWGVVDQQNWEFGGYIGILTLVLAGVSCATRRSGPLWAARIVLILALIMMLGGHTPIYKWLYHTMPGLSLFRIPARAVMMAHLALSVMAAFGTQRLLAEPARLWQRGRWRWWSLGALAIVLAVMLIALLVVGTARVKVPHQGAKEWGEAVRWTEPVVLRPMICVVGTMLVILAMRWIARPAWAALAMTVTLAADLYASNPPVPLLACGPLESDPSYNMMKSLSNAADDRIKPFRIDLPPAQNSQPFVIVNTALGARAEMVNGYTPMSIGRFYRFVHAMRSAQPSNMIRHELPESIYKGADPFPLRIMNVLYAVPWDEAQKRFLPPVEGRPLPRAWITDRAEVMTDELAILKRLRDRQFDPRTTVVLERPPRIDMAAAPGPVGGAACRRIEPGRMNILTNSIRDGYLVLSEVFYPGWKATVDGQRVNLERADYVVTALPLQAGQHTVVYWYDPVSFKFGAGVTGIMWLSAIVATVVERRRRSSDRSSQP
jgi:hypothetical protein